MSISYLSFSTYLKATELRVFYFQDRVMFFIMLIFNDLYDVYAGAVQPADEIAHVISQGVGSSHAVAN